MDRRSTPGSAAIRTASWCPASRSRPARSATASGWPWGLALALGIQGRTGPRVVVLVGDGELDEGSNLEAIQYAGRAGLANLTAVVVDNESAHLGWPGGISARFELEGWATTDVDGHDRSALERALAGRCAAEPVGAQRLPQVVVAHIDPEEAA